MPSNDQRGVSQAAAITAFTLGSLFFCYAFLQRVAPSIMTGELMRDFNVGGAALGSLSAFYFWAYAGIQLPVGVLTDRFGPRKLMSSAALICTLAAAGFALSESLFMASFWRAVIGGTVAFGFVGTLAISGYWFKHSQQATLAGVLQGVGMCGAVFAQAPLRPIVENFGWRHTMLALSLVALILAILLFTLVPKRSTNQKESKGGASIDHGLRLVTSNPQSWICAGFGFGMASTLLGFAGLWAVPWLNTIHGYSPTQAAAITSTFFVGWAVASPLVGWGSDLLGKRNTLMRWGAAIYIIAFSSIVFFTPANLVLLVALLFLAGAAGSTMTICFISVKELNKPSCSSTSIGLMNMFVVGSGAVMQPLIGWLLDLNWSGESIEGARIYSAQAYRIGFSCLLVSMAIAFIFSFLIRETYCKKVVV
jgi:MFS family permease